MKRETGGRPAASFLLLTTATLLLAAAGSAAGLSEPGVARDRAVCPDRIIVPTEEPPSDLDPGPLRGIVFPAGDIFRPLLADMKEPRFYASLRQVEFGGPALPAGGDDDITAAVVGLGETFGVFGLRQPRGCDGVQVSIVGGAFSQFNLDAPSSDLINTDFIGGLEVTPRLGSWSARVRLFHQSSHLGDEFLLNNPGITREDLNIDAVDALLSVEGRLWRLFWRLYGGGGYIFSREVDPGVAQWGVELRGPLRRFVRGTQLQPVFGADFTTFEERDWGVTTSLKGGVEWATGPVIRSVRLLVVYLDGFIPFGQFFSTTELTNFGLELQFDL